tara:strand:- start:3211 stop:3426 length:216 start_codon:yes stop_codon:yes gene_type:complete
MDNNAENRRRVATICTKSMTLQELCDALIYELQTRYKRQPGLFEIVVEELKELDLIDDPNPHTCESCKKPK